jgi:hypothetical protein
MLVLLAGGGVGACAWGSGTCDEPWLLVRKYPWLHARAVLPGGEDSVCCRSSIRFMSGKRFSASYCNVMYSSASSALYCCAVGSAVAR